MKTTFSPTAGRSPTRNAIVTPVVPCHSNADDTIVCEGDVGPIQMGTAAEPDTTFVVENPTVLDDRRSMRFRCDLPLAVVPVALDGGPGEVQWSAAESVDFSRDGIAFTLPRERRMDSSVVVIGVQTSRGKRFGVTNLSNQTLGKDFLRLGGQWLQEHRGDPFTSANLRPRINAATMQFGYSSSESCLNRWHELGVLSRYLIDRVFVCPACETLPTWRYGCHRCGSGRIDQDRLLHHFACAHVGEAGDFETAIGLQCPKCRTKNMIIGSDFEYIDGPLTCFDCNATGGQPTMSALCHRCFERFDTDKAYEKLLFGFNIDRLDVERDLQRR